MLSFEIVMFAGVYPASNVLFVILVIIILIPFFIYAVCKEFRQRGEHERMTN